MAWSEELKVEKKGMGVGMGRGNGKEGKKERKKEKIERRNFIFGT